MGCRIHGMMLRGRGVLRLLWLANWLILLAVLFPGLLGHPYPRPARRYIEWGGLLLYVVSGLSLVAVSRRLRDPSSKQPTTERRDRADAAGSRVKWQIVTHRRPR